MLIRYQPLNLPLEFAFTISRGSSLEARTVYVELIMNDKATGSMFVGMGEAVPAAFYGEDQASVCAFYDQLNQDGVLADLDLHQQVELERRLAKYPGHQAAKSALDMALYDLRAKCLNLPVWKMLGLNAEDAPKSSYTIGLADLETVRLKTQTAIERGCDVLKIKLGGAGDLDALRLVRDLAPEATIRVDANAAWTLAETMKAIPFLAEMAVEFIEEPLKLGSPEADYATLYRESPILLMADESCKTLVDIPYVARFFGAVNLKHTKTGGLSEALRMIHAARAHRLKIMLGCFCESSISISAFAQLSPLVDYADLDGALLVAKDPYEGIRFEGSRFYLNHKPGIGAVACSR